MGNKVLRILLTVAIAGALWFLDYKTNVNYREVETLDTVAQMVLDHQSKNGALPITLAEAGFVPEENQDIAYQKVSEAEFTLAHQDQNYFIDQNRKLHTPKMAIAWKLKIWEKTRIKFHFLYIFVIFAVFYGLFRKRSRRTTG